MSQTKDISLDGNEDLDSAIAKATQALKQQLAAKETEAATLKGQVQQVARQATDRDAAARKAEAQLRQTAAYATRVELGAITSTLAEHDARAASLQAQYAMAIETADGKKAAEINQQIADLAPRRLALQQGKEQLEEEIQTAQKAAEAAARQPVQQQRQPQPQRPADPFEAAIAGLPPTQQAWLRQHKDKGYVKPGQPPSPKLMKAYYDAQDAGLREDAPAFLAHMDKVLGHGGEQQEDASQRFVEVKPEQPKPQPQAKRAMPAAPVSRNVGGSAGTRTGSFRLTGDQAQTAERLGMTAQEYRQFQEVAVARGKLPASVLNQ